MGTTKEYSRVFRRGKVDSPFEEIYPGRHDLSSVSRGTDRCGRDFLSSRTVRLVQKVSDCRPPDPQTDPMMRTPCVFSVAGRGILDRYEDLLLTSGSRSTVSFRNVGPRSVNCGDSESEELIKWLKGSPDSIVFLLKVSVSQFTLNVIRTVNRFMTCLR